ncbi:ParB/RepB/Spo0J family partition protein [Trueperella pecoris]|uniref:ParB/RepB/Spo0J family partition protein n=1 Tax=Trueperella pecoris TaxID=2733571 RepID=UPI001ABE75D2|nr:ParB/RepB/Spo0J family partition protein [Trueperella pecoris]QTG75501.1 ParB/RepB/Spo0J family partition protein [Trueperella pecoris]
MADKRKKGLGRGLGALFPEEQKENKRRATDVFFSSPHREEPSEDATVVITQGSDDVPTQTPTNNRSDAVARAPRKEQKSDSAKGSADPAQTRDETKNEKNDDKAKKTAPTKVAMKQAASVKKTQSEEKKSNATEKPVDDNELLPVPGATFGEIPINEIVPNTRQPRAVFDEDELQELADSITEVGVLQPIVIRPLVAPLPDNPQARYELIMGERRWRASQRANKESIPAIVRHTEDGDLLRDALLENLHRANLNALEEAAAYQQLLDDFQCTQEELSRRIARSRPQISNTLRLLKLPPLVQRRVAAGVISAGHARALLGLLDPAAMERLAQRIVAEGLSVRQVEEIVALGEDSMPVRPRGIRRGRHTEELNELAGRLSDRFNTRVKVNMGLTKGKIAIEFATIDDLNRILDTLSEGHIEVEE